MHRPAGASSIRVQNSGAVSIYIRFLHRILFPSFAHFSFFHSYLAEYHILMLHYIYKEAPYHEGEIIVCALLNPRYKHKICVGTNLSKSNMFSIDHFLYMVLY